MFCVHFATYYRCLSKVCLLLISRLRHWHRSNTTVWSDIPRLSPSSICLGVKVNQLQKFTKYLVFRLSLGSCEDLYHNQSTCFIIDQKELDMHLEQKTPPCSVPESCNTLDRHWCQWIPTTLLPLSNPQRSNNIGSFSVIPVALTFWYFLKMRHQKISDGQELQKHELSCTV